MADRIAILKDGKLLQSGPPREVYEHPVNRFAADFIGVMNFFAGVADATGLLADNGTRIIAPNTSPGRAVAAVRPERIRLGPGENTLAGTVVAMAYHGLDLHLHVQTTAAPKPVILRLTADMAEAQSAHIGDPVTLGWAAKDTRIFPA